MLSSLIDNAIKKVVAETINAKMPEVMASILPAMMQRHLRKTLREAPNTNLTEAGFRWAFYVFLKEKWPDVRMPETTAWLYEYLGVSYGAPGYDWTIASAKDTADSYAADFSEAA